MERWIDFARITGGAAAALVGLLFVAVSIRADVIAKSQALRSRPAQLERVLDRLSPNVATAVLVGLSGVAVIFGVTNCGRDSFRPTPTIG